MAIIVIDIVVIVIDFLYDFYNLSDFSAVTLLSHTPNVINRVCAVAAACGARFGAIELFLPLSDRFVDGAQRPGGARIRHLICPRAESGIIKKTTFC